MDFDKKLKPVLLDIEKMFLEMGTVYSEAVYQNAVKLIFQKHGFIVSSEIPLMYRWKDMEIGAGRYDIVVSKGNETMIVELKATTNKKCKWSEIRQMKNYMFQNDFKNGIIINFPQIENHHETGIYFYSLLNCLWETKEKKIETSLGNHTCETREYSAEEIIKDDSKKSETLSKNKISFLYP